jgi:uncharacterized protein
LNLLAEKAICIFTREETPMATIDNAVMTEMEAAAFRSLVAHLKQRHDVQNIDMMNLAGFCRNCLANWLMEAATQSGLELDREASRELIYGMPYDAWKTLHAREASAAQLAEFEKNKPEH